MATKPRRGLLAEDIPLPAGQGYPQSPGPSAGVGGTLNSLSYGLGTGMRNQLAGLLEMAQHPMQYGNALLQAAMHPSQSVPAIGNALADQYRMAKSGAAGFGQVLGENISPRGLLGISALSPKPLMREITAYHGTAKPFDKFDDAVRGGTTGAKSAKAATWFTDDPRTAKAYSIYAAEEGPVKKAMAEADALERIAQRTGRAEDWAKVDAKTLEAETLAGYAETFQRRQGAAVLKTDIPDNLNWHEVDAKGLSPQELSRDGDIDSWLMQQINKAKKAGKDGVKITNLNDAVGIANQPATHYAVFDPKLAKILGVER